MNFLKKLFSFYKGNIEQNVTITDSFLIPTEPIIERKIEAAFQKL